jgi:hypothetical protein
MSLKLYRWRAQEIFGPATRLHAVTRPTAAPPFVLALVVQRSCASKVGRTPLTLDGGTTMNNIIYIVGAIVIVIALLSFFGLR